MAGSIIIIILLLTVAAARFAMQRHQAALSVGARVPMPTAQSAGEVCREFLDAHDAEDVRILEHTAMVSDYYDPGRRALYLNKSTMEGTDAASWAAALHEAAHALQSGESQKALEWRLGNIRLTRYAPAIIGFACLTLMVLKRLPFKSVLLICSIMWAVILLVNVLSLPIEFNASQRARTWLQGKLRQHEDALDLITPILQGVAWRDTGIFLKSPLYLLFGLLPVGGKLRPR